MIVTENSLTLEVHLCPTPQDCLSLITGAELYTMVEYTTHTASDKEASSIDHMLGPSVTMSVDDVPCTPVQLPDGSRMSEVRRPLQRHLPDPRPLSIR